MHGTGPTALQVEICDACNQEQLPGRPTVEHEIPQPNFVAVRGLLTVQ